MSQKCILLHIIFNVRESDILKKPFLYIKVVCILLKQINKFRNLEYIKKIVCKNPIDKREIIISKK